ncbi:MAG: radical SAM protein [Pseudomonadota bacterium]
MRFLLVNPFYPVSECPSPPLGLSFLAAALERADIETKILDLVVTPYSRDRLQKVIEDFSPDIIGSTAVTMTYDFAAGLIRDVKALAPEIKTVMGGPHVTFCAAETMALLPELDFIVMGEGEEAIVQLTRAVERGRGFEEIEGLAFRRDGRVAITGVRTPGLDVNDLAPPARHLVPLGRYRAMNLAIGMTTSRGCPFNCIFCVGRKMVGAKVRYRDPLKVVDELEYLGSLGFPQVNIADDLFTANKKHCFGVCDEILRRGLKIKWTSFARVDTVVPEVMVRMKEAGCTAVSFGVETGNPQIMKTIKKGITLEQVEKAVKMCADAGILPHASFILGLPGETPATVEETVAFGEKIKSYGTAYGFHLLAPFPGTEIRDKAEEYGIRVLTNDWTQYHANRAIVETPEAPAALLDAVAGKWEKEFQDYLVLIKEKMKLGTATEEEAWPLVNLERTVLIYDLMMDEFMEKKASWPAAETPGDEQALDRLISLAAEHAGKDRTIAEGAFKNAFEKNNIRRRDENGRLRWEWVDYL